VGLDSNYVTNWFQTTVQEKKAMLRCVQADPDIHLNKKNIKNQKVFFFFRDLFLPMRGVVRAE
jgi:hypothetical protein